MEGYPEPDSVSGKNFNTWNTFNGYESKFKSEGFEAVTKDIGEAKEFYSIMKETID